MKADLEPTPWFVSELLPTFLQVLATPQLPYTMLGIPNLNPLSCRRTGSVTVFVDKIGGVQWVTIAVSATDKVLGWLPVISPDVFF